MRRIKTAAVEAKHWKRIKAAHDPASASLVDPTAHQSKQKPPEELQNYLTEQSPLHRYVPTQTGLAKKLIHQVGDDRVMTKPYHAKIQSFTRSWQDKPIAGWATMATKALFDAAGISKLAEEVYAHKHDDLPVTVHRFAKDHDNVRELQEEHGTKYPIRRTPDPLQIQQIAIMDFLTNNLDRNKDNLLVSRNTDDDTGHHQLLAIDHERSFQYKKTKPEQEAWITRQPGASKKEDTPFDYLHDSALRFTNEASYNNGWDDAVEWWKQVAQPVKATFLEELQAIKDPRIAKHLTANFEKRWDYLNSWAQEERPGNLFDPEHGPGVALVPPEKEPRQTVDFILRSLPESPRAAIKKIADAFKTSRSPNVTAKLIAAYEELFTKLSPEEFVQLYDEVKRDYAKNIGGATLANRLIEDALQSGRKDLVSALMAWDAGQGKVPPLRLQQLRGFHATER